MDVWFLLLKVFIIVWNREISFGPDSGELAATVVILLFVTGFINFTGGFVLLAIVFARLSSYFLIIRPYILWFNHFIILYLIVLIVFIPSFWITWIRYCKDINEISFFNSCILLRISNNIVDNFFDIIFLISVLSIFTTINLSFLKRSSLFIVGSQVYLNCPV